MLPIPTRPEILARELALAAQIQRNFLPAALPEFPPLQIAAWLHPAELIGGDFYHMHTHQDVLAVLIGDVAGKGVPAAMFTSVMSVLLKSELRHSREPGQILRSFNSLLYDALDRSSTFITAFLAILTPQTDDRFLLTYASAGHTSALAYRVETGQVITLPSTSIPLGVESDLDIAQYQFSLQPGDLLLLYTDGFTESQNPKGRVFGTEAVIDIIHAAHPASADAILDVLKQAVLHHTRGRPLQDDAAAVVLRLTPKDSALIATRPFVFPAIKAKCLRQISALTLKQASLLRFPSPDARKTILGQIDLAVNEILNNIIDHAYRDYTGRIQGRVCAYPDRLVVHLVDSGLPFHQSDTGSLNLVTGELPPTRGYGLHLAR